MFSKLFFWLKCSRYYTLPMTFFSWLIIFLYSIKHNGNAFYGVLSLIGICLCHLATNLFDDYNDFKTLKRKIDNDKIILPNTQRGKCEYLLNNSTNKKEVLQTTLVYLSIASLIGLFFILKQGIETLIFIALGGLIILSYSFLSNIRLSEVAVGLAYGPLVFCGTYFVMTGDLSLTPLALSLPSMILTINLIYTDTIMDYDIDKAEGKKTFVGLFTKEGAITFQTILLTLAYLSIIALWIAKIMDIKILLALITIPLSIDLIKSERLHIRENKPPKKRWYHFPFEDWNDIKENRSESFMFRMYQARNLMIYTSCLISIVML